MTDEEEAAERVDDRVDEARDVYKRQGRIMRAVWIAVAVVLVVGGLAMLVLPGAPVTIVVPIGLGMLAAVFGWARRVLMGTVRKGVKAKNVVKDTNRKGKILGVAALVCLFGGVIALIGLWVVPG